MTHLADVVDPSLLAEHVAEGNIRQQAHPLLPLRIFNYTAQCQYSQAWDKVTMACRGLIVDADDRVVARPFRKFFNHNQPEAPVIPMDEPVWVTDKADGSLGILYPTPDGHAIATRGSFTSDQALHATELWQERYADACNPSGRYTYLFEIVYPANRIVVDYGDLDDLVFLGAVDIATGETLPPSAFDWQGQMVETFSYGTLAEALAAPPRPNAEGLVVHHVASDERVKIKQEDYLALHRIVTGLNARTVWEHLAADKPLADLLDGLPDEFHDWVNEVATTLLAATNRRREEAVTAYLGIMAQLDLPAVGSVNREDRKRFAEHAVQHPLKWVLFKLLDGKPLHDGLWKSVKPEAHWTPAGRMFTEDTA